MNGLNPVDFRLYDVLSNKKNRKHNNIYIIRQSRKLNIQKKLSAAKNISNINIVPPLLWSIMLFY